MTFVRSAYEYSDEHLDLDARPMPRNERFGPGFRQVAPLAVLGAVAGVLLLMASTSFAADAQSPSASKARVASAKAASKKPAPTSEAAPDAGTIERLIDEMVAELLAAEKVQTRGIEPPGPTGFDGVAWETGEGVNAGTSPFGMQVNQAIVASLAKREVTVSTRDVAKPKGRFRRFISGSFKVIGGGIALTLAVGDATGMPVSKVTKLVRYSMALAGKENVLPPNHDEALPLIRLVRETVVSGTQGPFSLAVGTARGNNAAYYVGDTLQVQVVADADCYVRVYHVTWNKDTKLPDVSAKARPQDNGGTFTQIYPNSGEPDRMLKAGTVHRFPGSGTGVRFTIQRPLGVDAIFAVASEDPSALMPEEAALKPATREIPSDGTRGVERVGPFLTVQNVDAREAREILTRGLKVGRVPGATPSSTVLESGASMSTVSMSGASPNSASAGSAGAGSANAALSSTGAAPSDTSTKTHPPAPAPEAQPPVVPGAAAAAAGQGEHAPGKPTIVKAICFFTTLEK